MKKKYHSIVERLFATSFYGGMKLGLENTSRLSQILGYPEQSFKSILVAGTNGKGSVSLKIAKALELSGFRVGLYTSPHISCFRERIKINGVLISESEVEDLLSKVFETTEKHSIPATFFEVMTLLAFCYFQKEQVDFAVLEVGLGGRLDATNIVMPVLSVITSINFDHTAHLGNSLESIATEKGGIIKSEVPVILGPAAAGQAILSQIAEERKAPVVKVSHSLSDFYDNENSSVARAALLELNKRYLLRDEAVEAGLLCRPVCRFQVLTGMKSPSWIGQLPEAVILDVAHNPNGLARLIEAVSLHYPNRLIRVLAGFSKDKDLAGCLSLIQRNTAALHLVQASHPRAASFEELQKILFHLGAPPVNFHESIEDGVKKAIKNAAEMGEVLVICGSFYIMNEVRRSLGIVEPRDACDFNESLFFAR